MTDIHELIDFVVCIYIVHKDKVLLVHHKRLNKWLPIGGHIELDEDPEEALFREVKEESGLEIEVLSEKSSVQTPGFKALYNPAFLDIHDISNTHKHIGLVYFAKANTDQIVLAEKEHNEIRWFTREELGDSQFNLLQNIQFYAEQALDITS